MSLIKTRVIHPEKNVSCLIGYEGLDTAEIARRRPRTFFLKTVKELQFEKENKVKLKTWQNKDLL